jgi:hypothetical protein
MFVSKNVAGKFESRRGLSAFTSNLAALLAVLVLGFPVTPATIRTTVAGWAIVAVASLQFVLRRIGPQVRLASIRTTHERIRGLNQKA